MADRGLGQIQRIGGPGHAAFARDGDKGQNAIDIRQSVHGARLAAVEFRGYREKFDQINCRRKTERLG